MRAMVAVEIIAGRAGADPGVNGGRARSQVQIAACRVHEERVGFYVVTAVCAAG